MDELGTISLAFVTNRARKVEDLLSFVFWPISRRLLPGKLVLCIAPPPLALALSRDRIGSKHLHVSRCLGKDMREVVFVRVFPDANLWNMFLFQLQT